jgi:Domain of unknown function (DUF4878)
MIAVTLKPIGFFFPYFYSMKKILFIFTFFALVISCGQQRTRPDDALETAREFIRSSLDGDYKWANELMLKDSVNIYEIGILEKKYNTQMSEAEKEGYKKSSIIVHSVDNASDSVVIVNYSNSFKKKPLPLKVIKKDGKWQVDLNYTFTGNL